MMKAITGLRLYRAFGFLLRPIGAFLQWRNLRLRTLALPTLKGMCADPQMANCWGRSIDRLWMDGGTIKGFRAGVKLGWTEYVRDRDGRILVTDRETFGRVTNAGRAMAASATTWDKLPR